MSAHAEYQQKSDCNMTFCKKNIYNNRDLVKALQKRKSEVGGVLYNTDPEYVRLAQCKGLMEDEDDFWNEPLCKFQLELQLARNAASANAKSPSARAKAPSARANAKKCPKGTRRNKKTGNCDGPRSPKPKTASAKPKTASAKPKTKRCPKGFKRSKKTGNCERR